MMQINVMMDHYTMWQGCTSTVFDEYGFQPGLPLCQRAHELRVIADESGVGALFLEELPDELVQQARGCLGRRAVDPMLLY